MALGQSYGPVPKVLSADANAVIRKWDETFEVLNPGKALHTYSVAITILNRHADKQAYLVIPYSKLNSVSDIRAAVYDKSGKKVRTLKRKEIDDYSNFSSISVLSDNRIKVADLQYHDYPYTVEYSYTITTTNMMFYPVWEPLDEEKVALEDSQFRVVVPKGNDFRYRGYNVEEPQVTPYEDKISYLWKIKNRKPISFEPLMNSPLEVLPAVVTAPTVFQVEGYTGDMSTWRGYGDFIRRLNEGRNDLPEDKKEEFRAIAAEHNTTEAKVRALYEHLQNNTRYVSIQLGLGGWQPFKTAFVDEQGYGDCKALSFYMQAMLDAAGIPSHYTLVKSGPSALGWGLKEEFPYSSFNHVILGVPNGADTLWLECTSQTGPFNNPGLFTGNRDVLMITDYGGAVVKTQQYTPQDNAAYTWAQVAIDAQGNAEMDFSTLCKGMQYDVSSIGAIQKEDEEDQRKWLYSMTSLPSFETQSVSFTEDREGLVQGTVKAKISARRVANVSGKRMFVTPNLFSQSNHSYVPMDDRQTRMELTYGYENIDTVSISIPDGYYPEVLPEPIQIESDFGSYSAEFQFGESGLLYIRRNTRLEGVYDPEQYNEFVEYLNKIKKADRTKVVLVNRT